MKNLSSILILILIIFSNNTFAQISDSMKYLSQTPPEDTPVKFASGIISLSNRIENVITFSNDGKMCFFSISGGSTYYMEYKNGIWSNPQLKSSKFGGEPFFSLDNQRVYLNSKEALNNTGGWDISYSERKDTSWLDPVSLGSPLNSSQGEWHPCIVADGSIYFSSNNGPICRSQFTSGAYQKPVFLPYPINGFSGDTWGDPYVSPDESYIILRSGRAGGFGNVDLYISYKKTNGSWTNPKNLGNKINTAGEEFSGDITPDGKYMFYGRGGDIYWVKGDFIDSLKRTNFIPYIKTKIPNQEAKLDSLFSFNIPDTTFIDDDGNLTLTYTAALNNGDELPSWLKFNPSTKTFSGYPSEAKIYTIKVTVTDSANIKVSTTFKLTVTSITSVKKPDILPAKFELSQNYPNPFNPSTNICYQLPVPGYVKLKIYNILGEEIKTLVDAFQNAGKYTFTWKATDNNNNAVSSGVYFYRLETDKYISQKKMILLR